MAPLTLRSSYYWPSMCLHDALIFDWAFGKLTQRTQRMATENTEMTQKIVHLIAKRLV
jgi:hypothetical protein